MKVCHTIPQIRAALTQLRPIGKVGFVPTMGALHEGHMSLVAEAKNNAEVVVASIFVNPTQFNNPEDLEKYPRTLDVDLEKLEGHGCNLVFVPSVNEMYSANDDVKIDLGSITRQLEGAFRPGHFDGVGLVVSKLFNIIQPDMAFFGQKDLQQFYVIKKLVEALNFPIVLKRVTTVRETNGLAMSSRNMRMNDSEKQEASLLYQSLLLSQQSLRTEPKVALAKQKVEELFQESERLQLEYFEVVDTSSFKPLEIVLEPEKTAMCIAAEIGGVRLIDNLLLIS